jgi:tetratricopeptide (TPR) repeat protein
MLCSQPPSSGASGRDQGWVARISRLRKEGVEHPSVASAVNNLGLVLKALGDLVGARAAFERALAMGEAAFGPHHPNVALCLWNLGTVLQEQGEIQGAREAYQRALATFERFLGPDHPHTRRVRRHLDSLPQG